MSGKSYNGSLGATGRVCVQRQRRQQGAATRAPIASRGPSVTPYAHASTTSAQRPAHDSTAANTCAPNAPKP
eukprot:2890108-Rhodomonas_salina.1